MSRQRQHLHDQCHTFGHAGFEVDGDYKPLFGYLFALRCERCGCPRAWVTHEPWPSSTSASESAASFARSLRGPSMMTSPDPKFKEGDEVVSFRGARARILTVQAVPEPGKSHRVTVHWANELDNPDKREYYEEVFNRYEGKD